MLRECSFRGLRKRTGRGGGMAKSVCSALKVYNGWVDGGAVSTGSCTWIS